MSKQVTKGLYFDRDMAPISDLLFNKAVRAAAVRASANDTAQKFFLDDDE
jgi:hypothetical protein